MLNNYHQKHKEKSVKGIKMFLKKKKTKSANMLVSDI